MTRLEIVPGGFRLLSPLGEVLATGHNLTASELEIVKGVLS